MSVKNIDATIAQAWLNNKDAILIDVREKDEYKAVSIPGSQLIPLPELHIDKVKNPQGQKVIIHCQSGGRSAKACLMLKQQQPEVECFNLAGGIIAWREAGLPIHTS